MSPDKKKYLVNPEDLPDDAIPLKEAAKKFGYTEQTLETQAYRGKISLFKTEGGRRGTQKNQFGDFPAEQDERFVSEEGVKKYKEKVTVGRPKK